MPQYIYKNQDITLDILMKIEEVVRFLSGYLKKPFDKVLGIFYQSRTFASLKNPKSEMWAESAQFIADEFLREK